MGRFSKLETHEATPIEEKAPEAGSEKYGAEPATYGGLMRDADEHFYRGEWKRSLQLYSRALERDNTQPDPWVGQVLALLFLSQMREATVWAKRSLECFSEHPVALSLHALTMSQQGMTSRGLGTSDYAMEKGQTGLMCWISRGWILLEAGNANWEFCFGKAKERAPADDWQSRMLVGLILERYKKWPQAVEAYQSALGLQTANFFLWHRVGICYGKLGLARKAMEAHQHALDLNPRCAEAEKELLRQSGLPIGGLFARVRGIFSRKSLKTSR